MFLFKDYLIFDNLFKDPDSIVQRCDRLQYFPSSEDVQLKDVWLGDISRKPTGLWKGLRTNRLDDIDKDLFHEIFSAVFQRATSPEDEDIAFNVESYMHLFPGGYWTRDESWFHRDRSLLAGVIYLNKNPAPESGTTLLLDDVSINLENKFNRCVIYNSRIQHAPHRGFGDSIHNCRKAITFFINEIKSNC